MAKVIKFLNGSMYEYEDNLQLVDKYDPILKQTAPVFDFQNPPVDPKYIAMSLVQKMRSHGGVGLAANQVGWPYRVFVMGINEVAFACFNPEVLDIEAPTSADGSEEKMDTSDEGCLSFPGLFLAIPRAKRIRVRYTDFNGVTKETVFEGITARAFQHELDHLNGITFTTKVSSIKLDQAKRKVKTNLKKMERQRAQIQQLKKLQKAVQETAVQLPPPPAEPGAPKPFVLDTSKL